MGHASLGENLVERFCCEFGDASVPGMRAWAGAAEQPKECVVKHFYQ
jgi:hypothetical protein